MSSCNGNCSTCGSDCADRKQESLLAQLNPKSSVKKVIAVVSGKGGVGKSTVTSLLAVAMSRKGKKVAVLDADITGPSAPTAFGVHECQSASEEGIYPAVTNTGIQVMSINLLLDNNTDPVVWRGPVIAGAVKQFWTDVIWEDVDYMMANMMHIPVLGFVENYSYLECPDCGKRINVFGESHLDEVAKEFDLPVLARLPIDPAVAASYDGGMMESVNTDRVDDVISAIENA